MDHWRAALPVPVHEVDYEETVADLEGVARRLIDACGLEWEPACLEFHRTERPVRTASVTQVRQPIYTAIGRPLEELRAGAGRAVRGPPGGVLLERKLIAYDASRNHPRPTRCTGRGR